ncbi:hypothetical protein H4Q26_003335 [Puccinia striiformis f. sp. tritici PST-130]|nr:hypothetical protein H4Q26_003335 [Puccinia striiformis f. sp. tritici PST-130]
MAVESRQIGQMKRHVGQDAGIKTAILAISHAAFGQHHSHHGHEPTNLASRGSEPTNLAIHEYDFIFLFL